MIDKERETARLALLVDLQLLEVKNTQLQIKLLKLRKVEKKKKIRRRRRRRSCWVRRWLLRRPELGQWENLVQELREEDPSTFRNYHRLDRDLFYEVLQRLAPHIEKQVTNYRKPLEPGLRLSITLRFLATGDSFKSLSYSYRVAHNTISKIVYETCEAIITEYKDEVLNCPITPEAWLRVADVFSQRWNFHNTIGALDGKHIAIKCPNGGGSHYYNYKHFHSIVMLALVDANYKFLYVDVGANGACSDAGIFTVTDLRLAIEGNSLGLPAPTPLPGSDRPVPYHIVGDEAFPLREWLMKPFPHRGLNKEERIFNYRLSRARRIVENAFGIMANRFRCLLTTMSLEPKRVESVTLACCCLHNLLRDKHPQAILGNSDAEDPETHAHIPGAWRENSDPLEGLQVHTNQRGPLPAKLLRQHLKGYYNSSAGSVPWQDNMI